MWPLWSQSEKKICFLPLVLINFRLRLLCGREMTRCKTDRWLCVCACVCVSDRIFKRRWSGYLIFPHHIIKLLEEKVGKKFPLCKPPEKSDCQSWTILPEASWHLSALKKKTSLAESQFTYFTDTLKSAYFRDDGKEILRCKSFRINNSIRIECRTTTTVNHCCFWMLFYHLLIMI